MVLGEPGFGQSRLMGSAVGVLEGYRTVDTRTQTAKRTGFRVSGFGLRV